VLLFAVLLASSLYTGKSYNLELHDSPYAFYEELADAYLIVTRKIY